MSILEETFLATTFRQFLLTLHFLASKLSGRARTALLHLLMPIMRCITAISKKAPQLFIMVSGL